MSFIDHPHTYDQQALLQKLDLDLRQGLSLSEVARRQTTYGPNVLPGDQRIPYVKIFLHQFRSLMVLLLSVAAVLSWFMNHQLDAVIIVVLIVLNVALGFYEELKAEKAVKALQNMVQSKVLVRRAGQVVSILTSHLVPGDVLLLETGNKVPADARLISVESLQVMESALTGESEPVEKQSEAIGTNTPLAERSNMVFMGTLVTRGGAEAVVTAIGGSTELGKIAVELDAIVEPPTHFETKTAVLTKVMATVAIISALFTFFVGFAIRQFPLWDMVLYTTATLVSALPESLPIILTLVLAIGAQRMARKKAIVRKLAAVETLGVVSTILTDKTGTLTLNQMQARVAWVGGDDVELTKLKRSDVKKHHLAELVTVAGHCTSVKESVTGEKLGDPTEVALYELATQLGFFAEPSPYIKVLDLPFIQESRVRASLVETSQNKHTILVVGAPEAVLERSVSRHGRRLTARERAVITKKTREWSKKGLRVLGLAQRPVRQKEHQLTIDELHDLELVGLVGLIDPPRSEVRSAIEVAKQAGVRVVMVTGDHPLTAMAIAEEIGLAGKQQVALTESDIQTLSDTEVSKLLKTHSVFARLTPTTKLRLAKLLQKQGEVIAMTGDGVNDAPALKQADVGISMGRVGTDVAREASDIVLTDDNFASIIKAIKEGRTLFSNVRRTSSFLIVTNVSESVTLLLALLIGFPLPLLPLQILWLNIVTGGVTDFALANEPSHADVMKVPPRSVNENVLTRRIVPLMTVMVVTLVLLILGVFWYFLPQGEAKARTAAFTMISLTQLLNMFNFRSLNLSAFRLGLFTNRMINLAFVASFGLLMFAIGFPPARHIFGFTVLSLPEFTCLAFFSLVVFVMAELVKRLHPAGTLRVASNS